MDVIEIERKVKEIIAERMKIDTSEIKSESRFVEDLGADSLTVIDIVMKMEEEFGLDEIPDEDLEKIRTVKDAVEYIKSKTG